MTTPPTPTPPGPDTTPEETDPRFPSGPWTGFFLMEHWPGRHQMELHLSFRQGVMTGEGARPHRRLRDPGEIQPRRRQMPLDEDRYVGQHDVAYQGFNEGKGIWGVWEIPPMWKGGFHIWPEGMGDPTSPHLAEAIDAPAEAPTVPAPAPEAEVGAGVAEPEPVGASAGGSEDRATSSGPR